MWRYPDNPELRQALDSLFRGTEYDGTKADSDLIDSPTREHYYKRAAYFACQKLLGPFAGFPILEQPSPPDSESSSSGSSSSKSPSQSDPTDHLYLHTGPGEQVDLLQDPTESMEPTEPPNTGRLTRSMVGRSTQESQGIGSGRVPPTQGVEGIGSGRVPPTQGVEGIGSGRVPPTQAAPGQSHGPSKRPRTRLDEEIMQIFGTPSNPHDALIQSQEYQQLVQQSHKIFGPATFLKQATKKVVERGKYQNHRAAVLQIAASMQQMHEDAQQQREADWHEDLAQGQEGEAYQDDYDEEGWDAPQHDQHEEGYFGDYSEQVSSKITLKHKAYQKSLTQVDKITPNTKSRKLDDYLTEVQFHAELTYGHIDWEHNPTAIKAIVLTTFSMELRRQFLTKFTDYSSSSWDSLKQFLKTSTDQTPDDIKLQAITKLRLNQHAQGRKTLAEYNTQFTTLLQHAKMDTHEHTAWAIQTYLAGLNTTISAHMLMNPVTNEHWTCLEEVKQCAYRLHYQNTQSNSNTLAVIQAPPSQRGRGRSPFRGRGTASRGRGRSGGRYVDGRGQGYGRGQAPHNPYGRGYGSGRGNGPPPPTGYGRGRGNGPPPPSKYGSGRGQGPPPHTGYGRGQGPPTPNVERTRNRSLYPDQEQALTEKGICLYCFEDFHMCGGRKCAFRNNPKRVWDIPAGKLKGVTLKDCQFQGIFPELHE